MLVYKYCLVLFKYPNSRADLSHLASRLCSCM